MNEYTLNNSRIPNIIYKVKGYWSFLGPGPASRSLNLKPERNRWLSILGSLFGSLFLFLFLFLLLFTDICRSEKRIKRAWWHFGQSQNLPRLKSILAMITSASRSHKLQVSAGKPGAFCRCARFCCADEWSWCQSSKESTTETTHPKQAYECVTTLQTAHWEQSGEQLLDEVAWNSWDGTEIDSEQLWPDQFAFWSLRHPSWASAEVTFRWRFAQHRWHE